ncbi:cycloartenol-C-24-methyltransferase [Senna tora]|uniref:Cycloartenol-C-24-methyltransferase n=1 Tax=Senna tora TaxID=362788 RepID=A0A834X0U1_9FABA|nr:cycloartenol-C-24-methyltransferase [Senna tora]
MPKAGAMDLASGLGGHIDKSQVLSAVDKYEKYHNYYGGDEEERKANYTDMVNKYYDLVTSFYEFGWGESFHFAPRWNGESLQESIKRHEHFLALQLALKPGQKELNRKIGVDKTCNYVKVKSLEYIGLAPKGSLRVQQFLEKAAEGLVEGGKKELINFNSFMGREFKYSKVLEIGIATHVQAESKDYSTLPVSYP